MKQLKSLYKQYREIINYLIVGGCTTVVSLGSFFLLTRVLDASNAIQLQIANVISWICAVSFAYVTNRKFVFESKNNDKLREMFNFVGSRVSTLVVEMVIMAILVSMLRWNENLAKLFVQIVIVILNYILSKFLVFNYKGK